MKELKLTMVMTRTFLFIAVLIAVSSCKGKLNHYQLTSPGGNLSVHIELINHSLKYSISSKDQERIRLSSLGIFPDAKVTVLEVSEIEKDTSWKPVWGQQSHIRDYYRELDLNLEINGIPGNLMARAYNDGVAFRFVLAEGDKPKEAFFNCEYNLFEGDMYFFPMGETEPLGPLEFSELNETLQKKEKKRKINVPLVSEQQNGSYVALLESDLYSATGIQSMKLEVGEQKNQIVSVNRVELSEEAWKSPWRIILLGDDHGDLVMNTVPLNLATPSQLKNTDWIKPGKTLWDWRVHGYTAPDGFVYGINTESYKRFIDFAEDKGIEYFLIDDSWYKEVTKGHFEMSDKLNLQEVIDYAEDKKVKLMLYYDRRHGEYGDDELFEYYRSLEMKGIKYGFMGNDVDFTRSAIQKSAENKLLIDFHDGPVPFTGISRTYPNAITREYCHAQQDSRRAFTPESFIKMALINAITGPLDMNNGNFDLTGINAGLREKGPREKNSYFFTVSSEMARTLIIYSGLVCIPDAPEVYEAKSDLFEFIQKMPVGKWDESRIVHSKIDTYITTARRHDQEWFVGSVYNQKGGALEIKLDFLDSDLEYDITFYEDTPETHCKTNPEAYQVRAGKVNKGDVVKAVMAPGGGHSMWIRPH
ncbi:glycoside hydrolase family 97 protein [Pseudozobellia sp. WGM2]|uniref:glycoside hydrolase family 97 protein n=1 Tax=Pseudozobellia sp. WGM2 TaxID=2787625 RepID=UPI001ADFCAE7|nr:glycoside hydrolase family 97 protein [Pseudozobellia sp. WGM2]